MKFLKFESREFTTLNLSNSNLKANIMQFCELVEMKEFRFTELILSNNFINSTDLNFICSSITGNKTLKKLDISDNQFEDASLKVIYPFLQK